MYPQPIYERASENGPVLDPIEVLITLPKLRSLEVPAPSQAHWSFVLNRGFEYGYLVIGSDDYPEAPKAIFKIKSVHSTISHLSIHDVMRDMQHGHRHDEYRFFHQCGAEAVVELGFYFGIVYDPTSGRWIKAKLDENPMKLDSRLTEPQRDQFSYPVGNYGNLPVKFLYGLEKSRCQYKQIVELIELTNQNLPEHERINTGYERMENPSRLLNFNVLPWAVT